MSVPITVVETPAFLRAADQVLDEEQRGRKRAACGRFGGRPKEKASEAESE